MNCSIIICTRNRAPMLAETLERFLRVSVPTGWEVEMIVADNGSTDETAAVIQAATHSGIVIRHVFEEKQGKSRAQNSAMAVARGECLLFTDDDVEPAENWIDKMASPLLDRRCDAVVGRILLGEELRRSWMKPMHEMWLAAIAEPEDDVPILIGACMGIHRSVFERIGNFDEELGPGATGFGEETLLWYQMKEAGMRILPVRDTFVIHHPDVSRLQRSSWLGAAKRYGQTVAYIEYHWNHEIVKHMALRLMLIRSKLVARRCLEGHRAENSEGCPTWEMSYLVQLERLRQFQIERLRPRNYEQRGLRRIEVVA